MEIIGVGTDIIEIPRIKSAMEKEGFAEKVEACYLKAIEAHKRG